MEKGKTLPEEMRLPFESLFSVHLKDESFSEDGSPNGAYIARISALLSNDVLLKELKLAMQGMLHGMTKDTFERDLYCIEQFHNLYQRFLALKAKSDSMQEFKKEGIGPEDEPTLARAPEEGFHIPKDESPPDGGFYL